MPSKIRRQQIRLPDDLADKVRQLGELWAGAEGPLTPSAVFRVAVERAYALAGPVILARQRSAASQPASQE